MKISSFNNYSMNKPPSADRIQKIVQQLNTRAQSSISSVSASGRAVVKAGLDEIEEGKDKKDSLLKLLEKRRVSGGSGESMDDLYVMLDGMKKHANIIGKYEALAADETKSNEERAFYQNALRALKEGFKTELSQETSFVLMRHMSVTGVNSKEFIKELGLENISEMTSQEIIKAIEKAQKSLGKPKDNDDNRALSNMYNSMFESRYTQDVAGFDKYGIHDLNNVFDPDNVTGEIISFQKAWPISIIDTKA